MRTTRVPAATSPGRCLPPVIIIGMRPESVRLLSPEEVSAGVCPGCGKPLLPDRLYPRERPFLDCAPACPEDQGAPA